MRSAAPALRLFLLSRAAIWLLALAVVLLFEGSLNARRGEWDSDRLHDLGAAVDVWARWDSDWFLRIAENGYSWPSSTPAFFPLYPLLVAGVGRRCSAATTSSPASSSRWRPARPRSRCLYRLTLPTLGRGRRPTDGAVPRARADVAVLRRGLQRVALPAPRGGGVPPAERGRFWGAGAAAGLALLTRSAGIALLPALVLLAWRAAAPRRARSRASPWRHSCSRSTRCCSRSGSAGRSRSSTLRRWSGNAASHPPGPLGGVVAAVQHQRGARPRRRGRPRRARRRRLAPDRGRVRALRAHERRSAPVVRVGQGAALVDAAVRGRRLPGVHGARDDRASSPRAMLATAAILGAWLAVDVVRWALWYWVA